MKYYYQSRSLLFEQGIFAARSTNVFTLFFFLTLIPTSAPVKRHINWKGNCMHQAAGTAGIKNVDK